MKPLRIGDRVEMTASGRRLARERKLPICAGEVRDACRGPRGRLRVYVLRDLGGALWWVASAWRVVRADALG